jgi:hypothetical protein
MAADRADMLSRLESLGAIASGSQPAELLDIFHQSQRMANFGKSFGLFHLRELTEIQEWRMFCLMLATTCSRHRACLASGAEATLELEYHLSVCSIFSLCVLVAS